MNREEQKRLERVVSEYPGATFIIEPLRRHERVVLVMGGRKTVTKSKTASCRYAFNNFLGDVRRSLRELAGEQK